MANEKRILLDTSAILTLRSDEAGAEIIENLLRQAEKTDQPLLASFMTRMELLYVIWKHEGELAARHAISMVDTFAIEWISCEPEILDQAAKLKGRGGLSVADSWIAATAIVYGATLIHKDPEICRLSEIPQRLLES